MMDTHETRLPLLTDIAITHGMRVIVRSSLDVPITDGVVTNDFRITQALPTINFLLERGARVILMTHVGRDPENTTLPIFNALKDRLPVRHIEAVMGDAVTNAIDALPPGEVLLLGNLRMHREEEVGDVQFAETLASYGDLYVNDAFAVSHRPHASIVGITEYIPACAGITFAAEYENLARALNPEHPAVFILGGAKFETKAPLIERYAHTYDTVMLGGALANDFLKGRGCEVGTSLVSNVDLSSSPLITKENILVPVDVVVWSERGVRTVAVTDVQPDESILDIGPTSLEALAPHVRAAKTILWNGPLGYYEGGFDAATKACAQLVSESDAFSIVGGGDTVASIEALGLSDTFGFLSTAGGAMLEFLEKGTLPGIDALMKKVG